MSLVTSTVTLGARRPVRSATNSNARSTAFPPDTAGTAPRHRQSGPAIVTDIDDANPQVQLDGNSKRIEATTQVRHRTRDHDFGPQRGVGANGLYGLK